MTLAYWTTFATGLLILFSSACVGLHEILLSPERPNYPNGGRRLRVAMFLWSAALLYRGAEVLTDLHSPSPTYVTYGVLQGSLALAAVQYLALELQLRRWLPARLQRRIQQLLDIASCGYTRKAAAARRASDRAAGVVTPTPASVIGPALAELTLAGWTVVAPLEGRRGAEAIGDHALPREPL